MKSLLVFLSLVAVSLAVPYLGHGYPVQHDVVILQGEDDDDISSLQLPSGSHGLYGHVLGHQLQDSPYHSYPSYLHGSYSPALHSQIVSSQPHYLHYLLGSHYPYYSAPLHSQYSVHSPLSVHQFPVHSAYSQAGPLSAHHTAAGYGQVGSKIHGPYGEHYQNAGVPIVYVH